MRRYPGSFGLLAVLFAALPMPAQDMVAVTSAGQVLRLSSQASTATILANGQAGKAGLACTTDNRLWTIVRSGSAATGFHFHLAVIDPFTGAEVLPFGTADVGDIRALAAPASVPDLFGIRDVGGPDQLVRISTSTGAVTVLGPTGFSEIVGLDITQAGARAWDGNAGLLNIALGNGAATDPFPGVSGPTGMRFLVTDPATLTTYVGGSTLHVVSLTTGATSGAIAAFPGFDIRGAAFTTSRLQLMGQGCQATTGPSAIGGQLPLAAGQPFTAESAGHLAGAIGLQIIGFSQTTALGQPLPIPMDPIFGTSGCFLRVSVDFTVAGVCNGSGRLPITIQLPPVIGFQQFYVQHAVLEPVPGGISFSNGLRVRPGL